MKRFLAIFSFFILFGFIITVLFCLVLFHHKAEIVKRVTEQIVRKQLPDASIRIGSADIELPDELHFSHITISSPSRATTIRLDSLVIEFDPTKIRQMVHRTSNFEAIERISLLINELLFRDLIIRRMEISVVNDTHDVFHINGAVNAREILYKKFILSNVQTDFDVKNKVARIDIQKINLGEGSALGSIVIDCSSSDARFNAKLFFSRLQSAGIINLLDLKDKIKLTGVWDGDITVSGNNGEVTSLSGVLTARVDGGTMHMLDKVMAQNMLPPNQPYKDKLMESIMHYTYNHGIIDISLEDMNILFDLKLNGETGKRAFSIYLHDLL